MHDVVRSGNKIIKICVELSRDCVNIFAKAINHESDENIFLKHKLREKKI